VLGACVGSFVNVVACRLPSEESVVHSLSHCPHCGTQLRWFENVPLVSWMLLKARCRHCGSAISGRYPAVELLTAGLFVATALGSPTALAAPPAWLLLLAGWLLVALLMPLTLIDLDHLWLPEPLCRWGVVLGLAITAIAGFSQVESSGRSLLLQHLLAACGGLLAMEGVSGLAQKVMGKPALGLGDAKLTALLGAWLGLSGVGLAVLLAVLAGALFGALGLLSGRLKRGQPFPFGPFLAGGGLAVWIGGNSFWLQQLGQWLGWGAL
jgi:leader peptidase (prepilin peptidase)/N-methyltransferase